MQDSARMRSYGQYCPIAVAAELLADRWTLLIVRELMVGSHRFNEIERGLPRISRSLLAGRLRQMERAGLVERRPLATGRGSGYHLTDAGQDLKPIVRELGFWAVRWAFADPRDDQVDGALLLWWLRLAVRKDHVPPGRTVVRFRLSGGRPARAWLVMTPDEVSVCVRAPGFPDDVSVTASTRELQRVFLGRTTLGQAMSDGLVQIEGPLPLVRAFPGWFSWSPYSAEVARMARPGVTPMPGAGPAPPARGQPESHRIDMT
jgi:DNA-binding HxlR family transcriptional regulator